jgi:hypothetical protein
MTTEYAANNAMATYAAERARWAAVLAPVAKNITQRRAARKSLIARLLGL